MSGPVGSSTGGACRVSRAPDKPPATRFARWPKILQPTRRDVRRFIGTRIPGARFYGSLAGECRCLNCWEPGAVLDFQLFQPRLWCAACGWFGYLLTQLRDYGWPVGPLSETEVPNGTGV